MFKRQRPQLPVFAFPCMTEDGCPEAELKPGIPGYCPCWQSGSLLTETEINTGQERSVKGCYFQTMPRLMVHVIRASNRPAEELGKMRTSVVNGVRAEVANKVNSDLAGILENLQVNAIKESLALETPAELEELATEQPEESNNATGQSFNFARNSGGA